MASRKRDRLHILSSPPISIRQSQEGLIQDLGRLSAENEEVLLRLMPDFKMLSLSLFSTCSIFSFFCHHSFLKLKKQLEEIASLRTAASVSVTQLDELHGLLSKEQRKVCLNSAALR